MRSYAVPLLISAAALFFLFGCQSREAADLGSRNASDLLMDDYPGWRPLEQAGPMRTQLIGDEDGSTLREDVAYLIESPDGTIRLLAWYARSGTHDGLADVSWVRLDELFIGDSWDDEKARALHLQMTLDNPEELLLGAYRLEDTSGGPEQWHVGFYLERRGQGDSQWIRGDHLYAYDSVKGTWSLVKADSGSDNAWNTIGSVKR